MSDKPESSSDISSPRPAGSTIHGYAAGCSPDSGWCSYKTFSYGVFPIVRTKDGQRWKRGKSIVRVVGNVAQADRVKAEAKRICEALDAGTYTGPKRVVVPWSNATPDRTATR